MQWKEIKVQAGASLFLEIIINNMSTKPIVKHYVVRFFGSDEKTELSLEEGHELIMFIYNNPKEKFIMLGNSLVNISSIKSVDLENKISRAMPQSNGSIMYEYERRELNESERKSLEKFNSFFNGKSLKEG